MPLDLTHIVKLRENLLRWVIGMAGLMLVSYPFLMPTAAGTLNLLFVIVCTVLGFTKWGLVASAYTIVITWVMDVLFWHEGFPPSTYIFGTFINITISVVFGTVLENKNRYALTDGLTGLLNHYYLHEFLAWEMQKSVRFGRNLTFVMIDIDDFKPFNERFGHQFGDRALKFVAGVLCDNVRKSDRVARYGGDEFAIIMPETDAEAASRTIDRIVNVLARTPMTSENDEVYLSVSIGGSEIGPGATKEQLIDKADRALAMAKREGKNNAVILKSDGFVKSGDSSPMA